MIFFINIKTIIYRIDLDQNMLIIKMEPDGKENIKWGTKIYMPIEQ
jgi:hypothetical protein